MTQVTTATEKTELLDVSSAEMQKEAPDEFRVLFNTSVGEFTVEAKREWAPHGVDRFYNLVRHRFFDGARFFRVVPDFIVQFGLPADPVIGKIWNKALIKDDPVTQSNLRGTISFAADEEPDTRSCQIFINFKDNAKLDAYGFAPFAKVVEGMEIVDKFYHTYYDTHGDDPECGGNGPDQKKIEAEGDAYLTKKWPLLDHIVEATVVV